MIYRQLGNTGLKVSQLGFGAMRLPMTGEGDEKIVDRDLAIPMIHRAFEAGVNYIDTAVGYCGKDSQRVVGEALKGWRDKVILSTKNHYFGDDEKEWWGHLENSLERLQVEHLDIYNHHGVNRDKFANINSHVGEWMRKAYDQGLVKHICCSFHDNNEALMELIDSGYPEVITLQYNLLDRSLEEGIAHAAEKGIGVIVMGPVGGGRLGVSNEVLEAMVPGVDRVPELAMRFVLANPNVSIALSGMSTMEHVEENIKVAEHEVSLTDADQAGIERQLARLKNMADLYCTGCRYCMPCPSEIRIARVFDLYNQGKVYGLWNEARSGYGRLLEDGKDASICTECGECEEKCPQNIQIREQLKQAHEALAAAPDSKS